MPMNLFEAQTPIGFRVRVSIERWDLIVRMKHPAMRGREDDVRRVLEQPEEIGRSRTDENVRLFYCLEKSARWICAVIKLVGLEDAFLITAYPTDAVKEGQTIWTR